MIKWKINKKEMNESIKLINMMDIFIHRQYIVNKYKEDWQNQLRELFKRLDSEKVSDCNGEFWSFVSISSALVRQTFPSLFANKVVGVQAMSEPIGLAYAMRICYNFDGDEK
jgi:hypothetical protein